MACPKPKDFDLGTDALPHLHSPKPSISFWFWSVVNNKTFELKQSHGCTPKLKWPDAFSIEIPNLKLTFLFDLELQLSLEESQAPSNCSHGTWCLPSVRLLQTTFLTNLCLTNSSRFQQVTKPLSDLMKGWITCRSERLLWRPKKNN